MVRNHLFAVAAGLAMACQPQPTAPVLGLGLTGDADWLQLTWAQPTRGDFSAFVLEHRQLPGDFQILARLPATDLQFWYDFPSEVPELTDHEFRLRAEPDPDGARVSAPVAFHRGLRPPTLSVQDSRLTGPLQLANRSALASGLRLVMTVAPCGDNPPVAPVAVELPVDAVAYTDVERIGWIDGARTTYHLSAFTVDQESASVSVRSPPAPYVAPADVTLDQDTTGVSVAFVSRSRCATIASLHADRLGGEGRFGTDASSPTAYGELEGFRHAPADPDQAGLYAYRACLWNGGGAETCAEAGLGVVPPSSMSAEIEPTPAGRLVVRTGTGALASATAGSGTFGEVVLRAPGPLGEDALVRPLALLAWGNFQADPQGHPHALLEEQRPASPRGCALVHAWHDGSWWQIEDVAPSSPCLAEPRLALGPDGTLHAAWWGAGLEVARRALGGWEALAALPDDGYLVRGGARITGDALGEPHVLIGPARGAFGVGTTWHHAAAGWTSEPPPPSPAISGHVFSFHAAPSGLVAATWNPNTRQIAVLEHRSTGWGTPSLLATYQPLEAAYSSISIQASHSADGVRLAVALSDRAGQSGRTRGRLWLRDAAGVVMRSWFPLDSRVAGVGSFSTGFTTDDTAWLLENLADEPAAGALPSVLFEEP